MKQGETIGVVVKCFVVTSRLGVGVGSLYYFVVTYKVTMPHPTKKKQRLEEEDQVASADSDFVASFDDLVDVLPNILGFLPPEDIMGARVCKNCRQAARRTIVPPSDFCVDSVEKFNAIQVMTRALPNLQQISIRNLGWGESGHNWSDGEDPDEEWAAETADMIVHDIAILSNFSKLRILCIGNARLNGRYPFLFNSFPLLQKLSITECYNLKWDLGMLAGFPLLKELCCECNSDVTGNVNSLRVLKETIEEVNIYDCPGVEGNFMDLADFPQLKELFLNLTAVSGDIRDIRENDFSSLEGLSLPKGVYGGRGYEFERISDAPDLVRIVYLLKKQRPALEHYWFATLSEGSPDWYESAEIVDDTPPLDISLIDAGSRIGYRWETRDDCDPCEVNWLDPEPDRESSHYAKYMEELQGIESQVKMYRGFHQPPTEEEYNSLLDEEVLRRLRRLRNESLEEERGM
jgi:hypothetical protein